MSESILSGQRLSRVKTLSTPMAIFAFVMYHQTTTCHRCEAFGSYE